jgi:hypothetical protein
MALPEKYGDLYLPVKFLLNSYRALLDGKRGVAHLDEYMKTPRIVLSDWKVIWIGACAILRTSVLLFDVDANSCLNERLREELRSEWDRIRVNKDQNAIFWEFLRKERDNIIHEYEWQAYEAWMGPDGKELPVPGLLSIGPREAEPVLLMRGGQYAGRNSLEPIGGTTLLAPGIFLSHRTTKHRSVLMLRAIGRAKVVRQAASRWRIVALLKSGTRHWFK